MVMDRGNGDKTPGQQSTEWWNRAAERLAEQRASDVMAMPRASTIVSSFRIGSILSRSFSILFGNIVPFGLISMIFTAPYFLIILVAPQFFIAEEPDLTGTQVAIIVLLYVLIIILYALLSAVLVYGTLQALRGHRPSLGACLGHGIPLILPVVGLCIVVGISVVLGAMLFIIPGLILATFFWVAIPVAIIERSGVFKSLGRSRRLTYGYRWPIFGLLLVILVINVLAGMVADAGILAASATGLGSLVLFLMLNFISSAFCYALLAVAAAVSYHDLRAVKEGTDVEQLAAVFD